MSDSSTEPNSQFAPDYGAKIQALREMIMNAERTIQGAKAMLLQIEGKKKTGRPKKSDDDTIGTVVEGAFDGQIMFGTDGKQYPVPANYASKSKLVEGDMLKLTITPDGSFIYKQIGPIERRHAIGIVSQDESGNYHIVVEGEPFRVLLASITYFRAEPGDEVAVMMPRDLSASWVAIENILQKGSLGTPAPAVKRAGERYLNADWKKDLTEEKVTETTLPVDPAVPDATADANLSPLDAWVKDMEAIEKEIAEGR
ncbi:MAG: hypothetical protein WAT81_00425 [Candidatus Moraniibacteriota bacterium]